jgi:hypothetical protein
MSIEPDGHPGNRDLLIRIDERVEQILANYVTQDEFRPVQRIVYGAIALALTAVGAALIGLVVVGGK